MSDVYRVYAVQYAERETDASEVFYGERERRPMGMAYFVWAVTDGARTVVVDLGFTEAVGTRRGRRFLRSPAEGLAAVGIDASRVERVVLTHLHYDHVGNFALFPRATFYVQAAEVAFWTGRHAHQPLFRHPVEVEDIVDLVRLNYAGRVRFVDGEGEILPGVRVHAVGGHTAGMQILTVPVERGQAVLASDASHYYRNLEENIPFPTLHDLPGTYGAFERIRELASAADLIVPGHDPLVLERLREVGPGVVML
jgi:glyoxylase-like metal-dependent hydrolase (beta-lactamase superfamily II)